MTETAWLNSLKSVGAKLDHRIRQLPLIRSLHARWIAKRTREERRRLALSYYNSRLKMLDRWVHESRETTNFTYDLQDLNLKYLAATISVVTAESTPTIQRYIDEILNDEIFNTHVRRLTEQAPARIRKEADLDARIGRRAGWYALVRARKPKLIVETGIDKGLGACVLCAGLQRNSEEGFVGHYYGTDINPNAGWLLAEPYSNFGTILFGDSLQSLHRLQGDIDLFINDSDHSSDYERAEYEAIRTKLAPGSMILGDNAHCNSELFEFSMRNGRKFLYWQEWPKDHWYPGSGIGFSY